MIDGASHTRLFFQVMLPMAKPGLISITIFNIIGQWNQYLLPVALLQGADAEDKWVLTQGIADISRHAGYEADWSGAVRRAHHRDPADDHRVHRLPAADPVRPHRRRRQVAHPVPRYGSRTWPAAGAGALSGNEWPCRPGWPRSRGMTGSRPRDVSAAGRSAAVAATGRMRRPCCVRGGVRRAGGV